jgi:predicted permease
MNLAHAPAAQRVRVTETSANFFQMLGSQPLVGRAFADGEDVPGRGGVAVISHGLWQQNFAGDRNAVGSPIVLNGTPATIVGVARPGFDYPARTEVWTPTTFDIDRYPKTGVSFWETVGRLKPGLAPAQATQMFAAEIANLYPGSSARDLRDRPRLVLLRDQLAGPVRQASLVLLGVVAFVLLMACANVSNLLLTRNVERRGELVIRATLGASRARLVRQLITESIVLAVLSAIAGLVVAHWVSRLAAAAQPVRLAMQQYSVLDYRVLAFAAVLAMVSGVAFGVVPALLIGRQQPTDELLRGRSASHEPGTARLRHALVGGQVALAVVLLAGSFVMGRSFLTMLGTDLGFDTTRVAAMTVSLAGTRLDTPDLRREYVREALARLRAVPGVESAAAVDSLPLVTTGFAAAHFLTQSGRRVSFVPIVAATPDFFRTMGTDILHGREFNAGDRQGSQAVAIVDEAFARAAGEGRTLVGQTVTAVGGKRSLTVVGIVRTVLDAGPAAGGGPQIYLPYEQRSPALVTLAVRVRGDPASFLAICRTAVQSVDRQVAVFGARTLTSLLADTLARPRFYVTAVMFFGGLALLLATIGLYGVASYSVSQRAHEIGVRIAVGATSTGVRLLVMRESLAPVGLGAVAGIAGALGLGRFLAHLIDSATRIGPATCAAAAVILAVTAALAVWRATGRMIRLKPIDVLRAE